VQKLLIECGWNWDQRSNQVDPLCKSSSFVRCTGSSPHPLRTRPPRSPDCRQIRIRNRERVVPAEAQLIRRSNFHRQAENVLRKRRKMNFFSTKIKYGWYDNFRSCFNWNVTSYYIEFYLSNILDIKCMQSKNVLRKRGKINFFSTEIKYGC